MKKGGGRRKGKEGIGNGKGKREGRNEEETEREGKGGGEGMERREGCISHCLHDIWN